MGPLQLIVLGFGHSDFRSEITAELERLRNTETVRVIDALALRKDASGQIDVTHLSNLTSEEATALGTEIGALIGLAIDGEGDLEYMGNVARGGSPGDEELWDVLDEVPNDSTAALILIEHEWAVPLREAIREQSGIHLGDGFISPLELVEVGLLKEGESTGIWTSDDSKIGNRGNDPREAMLTTRRIDRPATRRVARRR